MIKTSEVKTTTELSRKVINKFLDEDIFVSDEKFDIFYDNLNKAWKDESQLELYISTKMQDLELLHRYNLDSVKLIGDYIYLGDFNVSRFSKNKCFKDAYIDYKLSGEKVRTDLNKELVIEFAKSKNFKTKLLNMYNDYQKSQILTDNSYEYNLSDLYNKKITIDQASIEQQIYAYFKLEDDHISNHNFSMEKFQEQCTKEELIAIRDNIITLIRKNTFLDETKRQFNFFLWFNKLNGSPDNLVTSICRFLLLELKNRYEEHKQKHNIDGFYAKEYISCYRSCLSSLSENYMTQLRYDNNFEKQLENLNLTDLEIRELLRRLSFGDLLSLTSGKDQLIKLIDKLNRNFIFDLTYFNHKTIADTNLSVFYTDSFFPRLNMINDDNNYSLNHSLQILFIPEYVKVLYTYESEFEKLKTVCNTINKNISAFIPETTTITFINDENKDEIINRIV